DVEFGARALRRSRQRGHVVERMEAAAVTDILLRQQQFDLFEAFAETRLRFIGRDAEAAEFVRQKRARKSDVEPSARNAVEHRNFAGELERVVEPGQPRAGDEPHRLGARRRGGEENDRIGAIAAVTGEVMLDRARVRKAQWFRFLRDRKRLGVVIGGALVGVIDGGKKLHAELHGVPSFFVPLAWKCRRAVMGMSRTIGRQSRQSIERSSTSAHARASRLTACGRDLDFRSIVVDTRKVARMSAVARSDISEIRKAWKEANLAPLWENARAHRPPRPAAAYQGSWNKLRPLTSAASDVSSPELVERRVLQLVPPIAEHQGEQQTSRTLSANIQILLPGEKARPHRHTMNALRFVLQGSGATTIVDGKPCPMEEGDLILTPSC